MAKCEAWVGLAPPDESVDCDLERGHEGCHQGMLTGSVRDGSGVYKDAPVQVRWGAHPPAPCHLTVEGDGDTLEVQGFGVPCTCEPDEHLQHIDGHE